MYKQVHEHVRRTYPVDLVQKSREGWDLMKIGVVGCGMVGSAGANACVLGGVGSSIVLVDHNPDFAAAQAEDILHAGPFASPIPVTSGNYDALEGAGIVMIAAGVGQKPGESRLDLLKRNADVFRDVIPSILTATPDAILLIASNPVDVMTQMAAQIAFETHNCPPQRIIGSGTILDTARFRTLLGQHLGVSSHSVHGYVLGEHGDSEVLHWSGVTVGNMPLNNFAVQVNSPMTANIRAQIDDGVRKAAARIIKGKGATWYGIGAGLARIARAVQDDENAVVTCSMRTPEIAGVNDVCLSLPRVINASGLAHTLMPELSPEEERALNESAAILKTAADSILG